MWTKDKFGIGYRNRNQHELLYVATRGKIPAPTPEARVSSVIEAPRGCHSAKPDAAYEMIERAYPGLPKIELFARARRDGWAEFGNELGLHRELVTLGETLFGPKAGFAEVCNCKPLI